MSEQNQEKKHDSDVDRTLIRQRLALSPAERAKVFVESARNVAKILAAARRS